MGYYIQVPQNHGKTRQLEELYGAERILDPAFPPTEGYTLICVKDNGMFEAAGIIYDAREFEEFNAPDPRPTAWLLMDTNRVKELVPQASEAIEKGLEK